MGQASYDTTIDDSATTAAVIGTRYGYIVPGGKGTNTTTGTFESICHTSATLWTAPVDLPGIYRSTSTAAKYRV